jgi:hypothetical protein
MIICKRCNSEVSFKDVSPGYYAVCPEHYEDLYKFETEKIRVDFDSISDKPEFMSGDRYYAFSFGSSGVFGSGIWYYFWSDTIGSALAALRNYYPEELLNIRSAVLGEWDCNSFTLAGHIDHS